jgi:hypothetical protein
MFYRSSRVQRQHQEARVPRNLPLLQIPALVHLATTLAHLALAYLAPLLPLLYPLPRRHLVTLALALSARIV